MLRKNVGSYLFLLFSLFLASNCYSEVEMKLELERKDFLQYENILAKVTIRNLSGHPLVFGNGQNWKGNLVFDITYSNNNEKIPLIKKENPMFGKIIPPGATETVIVSIAEIYNLNKPGYYRVRAILSNSQLSANYQSNSIDFSVSNGIVVSTISVGIPELFGAKKKDNKIRNYVIKSFFDGIDKVYCLIVEDEQYVYGIARIGYDIGGAKPEYEVDNLSRIHILIQNSPTAFSYFIYDINCNLDAKKKFLKTDTTPQIIRDPDTGKILIAGGKEQID